MELVASALYYLAQSTLAMAALFLLADWVRRQRRGGDSLVRAEPMARAGLLGGLFAVLAVAAAGLPPLPGFLAKALLLAHAEPSGRGAVLWTVVLAASLVNVIALSRAGSRLFWQQPPVASTLAPPAPRFGERFGLLVLLAALLAATLFAAPLVDYAGGSAAQLADPASYRDAVLGLQPLPTTVPR